MDLHKRRTPYFWGKVGRSDKYSSALYYTNSQIATERGNLMEEIYISMKEASDLEGIPYATFSRWISQKEIDGTIEIQKRNFKSGGKERKYIKLTDLSPKAQKAYRAMKKIHTEEGSDIVMENLPPEEPWYLDTDVNWYIENHSQAY